MNVIWYLEVKTRGRLQGHGSYKSPSHVHHSKHRGSRQPAGGDGGRSVVYGDGPQANEIEERVRSGLKRLVWTLGATTPTSMRGAYPTCAQ